MYFSKVVDHILSILSPDVGRLKLGSTLHHPKWGSCFGTASSLHGDATSQKPVQQALIWVLLLSPATTIRTQGAHEPHTTTCHLVCHGTVVVLQSSTLQ